MSIGNNHPHQHDSSSSASDKYFWNQIWSISAQPKMKNFMWRLCSNALSTKYNLFRRKCSPSPICPICNNEAETAKHMIFECQWTRLVWFSSTLALKPPLLATHPIIQWLTSSISLAESKKDKLHILSSFVYIGWSIWIARNKFIFDHCLPCPLSVIQASSKAQSEFSSSSLIALSTILHCSGFLPMRFR